MSFVALVSVVTFCSRISTIILVLILGVNQGTVLWFVESDHILNLLSHVAMCVNMCWLGLATESYWPCMRIEMRCKKSESECLSVTECLLNFIKNMSPCCAIYLISLVYAFMSCFTVYDTFHSNICCKCIDCWILSPEKNNKIGWFCSGQHFKSFYNIYTRQLLMVQIVTVMNKVWLRYS